MKRLQTEFADLSKYAKLEHMDGHADVPAMSDALAAAHTENAKLKYQLKTLQRVCVCPKRPCDLQVTAAEKASHARFFYCVVAHVAQRCSQPEWPVLCERAIVVVAAVCDGDNDGVSWGRV